MEIAVPKLNGIKTHWGDDETVKQLCKDIVADNLTLPNSNNGVRSYPRSIVTLNENAVVGIFERVRSGPPEIANAETLLTLLRKFNVL